MVNEWTSNDVPSVSSLGLYNKRPDLDLDGMRFGAAVAFEAMVKHLNTHYPKPEARTAPAVTKAEIEKVVRGQWGGCFDGLTDAVWSLVSGADPAVFVVRESDVAAVEVEQDSHGEWFADGEHVYTYGAEDSRNLAGGYMRKAVRRLAVARAIEQDAAPDPVEELAGQIESVTRAAIRQVCDALATVAPTLDPLAVEQAMEVMSESRKIAAHILGQEDRHVDQ